MTFDSQPMHQELLDKLINFFKDKDEISGIFLSGSGVTGKYDEFSDIDLGFLTTGKQAREKIWKERWGWKVPDWFHRFDADHVKPYFIIYFFYPNIHVDLPFYIEEDLPSRAGGPFRILFDKEGKLEKWIKEANTKIDEPIDWSEAVHDDERFWAWLHYCSSHVSRNECYDIAQDFGALRNIIESWNAKLNGINKFQARKFVEEIHYIKQLEDCFPNPNKSSIKKAMIELISIQKQQRERIAKEHGIVWKTSKEGMEHIEAFVNQIK